MSDIPAPDQDLQLTGALRAGLEDFELDEADRALLEDGVEGDVDEDPAAKPVVAIVGRPNVGKSTLVNRIIGRREAVVEDVPGVTRDRVAYDAEWAGRQFTLVDTGGWEIDVTGIHQRVAEQAEVAIELADAVLFVVDAVVGATDTDEAVVKLLRRPASRSSSSPTRSTTSAPKPTPQMLWKPRASASRGRSPPCTAAAAATSSTPLLEVLPEQSQVGGAYQRRRPAPRRAGRAPQRRQVLAAQQARRVGPGRRRRRRRHDARPGRRAGRARRQTWRFVDTAGIRRRVHQTQGADFYASLRTQAALEKAEVAVVLVDASETISEQDVRVIQQVIDAGRALVLAFNKWDLVDEERRRYLEREIERDLVQVHLGAAGQHLGQDRPAPRPARPGLETALDSWETRIPTGQLNAFLGEIVAAHPHPVRGGKQPRILFATQAATRPPRFVSSPPASSRPATGASSSAGCASSSASRARRSRCRCGCARSGGAEPALTGGASAERCPRGDGVAGRAACRAGRRGPQWRCRPRGIRIRRCGLVGAGARSSLAPRGSNGLWRSLVAHLTGGQGVAGSNPVSPTKCCFGMSH